MLSLPRIQILNLWTYKNFSNITTSNSARLASRANVARLVTKAPPPRFVVISLAAARCRRAFILNTKPRENLKAYGKQFK